MRTVGALARAGGPDVVMAHLLDSVDVGLHCGEEAAELVAAAKPLQVSLRGVPLDANGVCRRVLGAARDLIALAVRRFLERRLRPALGIHEGTPRIRPH